MNQSTKEKNDIMKTFPVLIFIVICLTSSALGHKLQQWGEKARASRLIHASDFIWMNNYPPSNQVVLQRTFQYPTGIDDEDQVPVIGTIFVTHHSCGEAGEAEIQWGGPGHRYVGIEFTSVPGECISARVEIWSA